MPSLFTLEGPRLGSTVEYGPIIAIKSLPIVEPTPVPPPPPPPTTTKRIAARVLRPLRGVEAPSFGMLALISIGAAASTLLAMKFLGGKGKALRGSSMLDTIAKESRSPAEFARRAEAWNASLPASQRYGMSNIAKHYKKASPSKIKRLIREAYEERVEGRERLWSKMSRGLRATR